MRASLPRLNVHLRRCQTPEWLSVATRQSWCSDLLQKVSSTLCLVQTCHQNFVASLIQESEVICGYVMLQVLCKLCRRAMLGLSTHFYHLQVFLNLYCKLPVNCILLFRKILHAHCFTNHAFDYHGKRLEC